MFEATGLLAQPAPPSAQVATNILPSLYSENMPWGQNYFVKLFCRMLLILNQMRFLDTFFSESKLKQTLMNILQGFFGTKKNKIGKWIFQSLLNLNTHFVIT